MSRRERRRHCQAAFTEGQRGNCGRDSWTSLRDSRGAFVTQAGNAMTQRLWRAAALLLWTLAPPTFLCPTREFIYPCTCMDTFVGTYVMCSGIESDQMLRLPFQYLRDYNVSRLLLTNLNFSVPPDLFWGLRVGTLKITDSRFRVEEGTLEGRRSRVQSLEFMRSNVDTGLSFFGNLDFLETLCVQNSSVKHFSRDWLATLVNLTHLTVDSTVFQILDSDALSDLPRLGTLIWTNNDLRYIGREFLPRRSRLLKTLDLR
ncbi:hypothetical protein HPB47_006285 [Ixodes persulcatus]|uniref:Uncharacterized protein n=1 Tax=Ixodes persulcatus TaxID=34615 RepID=A0AC60PBN6_IXOPE|nr:hypothetical protein HPB47_006285 [Ixodes persulcatus]